MVQLRQDNALGTLWNMVGFQTKLKHGEQARIFRMIPGLANAEFARLGGLHRNTFLNSPKLLDDSLRLNADKRLRFAGQITGVEGYVESAAIGPSPAAASEPGRLTPPPPTGARRAITISPAAVEPDGEVQHGLPADERQFWPVPAAFSSGTRPKELDRKRLSARRARRSLDGWLGRSASDSGIAASETTRSAAARCRNRAPCRCR